MDQELKDNGCLLFTDKSKAIDYATWLSFKHRKRGQGLYSAITSPQGTHAVVTSETQLTLIEEHYAHPLHADYVDLSYDQLRTLATDDEPLEHWEELRGAFSTMEGELLRFILAKKIPLEKLIRYELASRGHDEDCKWVGFEKAEEIWLQEPKSYTPKR